MALNQKLTVLLEGRTMHSVLQEENVAWIVFTDHSEMRLKIAAPVSHESFNGRCVCPLAKPFLYVQGQRVHRA